MWYNKKQCYVNKKGAAMNQYIGQQFAALRYEKNIGSMSIVGVGFLRIPLHS